MLPHMTISLTDCTIVFYRRACKCQLFTDEGIHRLPKRLNYCFSVLATATTLQLGWSWWPESQSED